jgi:hypothetical protein
MERRMGQHEGVPGVGLLARHRVLAENGHWFNDPEVAELEGSDSVLVV